MLDLFPRSFSVVLFTLAIAASLCRAQPCVEWSGAFSGEAIDGELVYSAVVFDDGSGPALYVGGAFDAAGGSPANQIARWDGRSWSPLGEGLLPLGGATGAFDMAVFDDGSGPALFVAGNFESAGGVPAADIAKWDGTAWSAVGGGLNGSAYALAVFDDGTGSALYVAGNFNEAGGQPMSRVAKWNGAAWSPLGSGIGDTDGMVRDLAVFNDGAAPSLYAAGLFYRAGDTITTGIVRWDGAVWQPVGGGLDQAGRTVDSLAVYQGRLYAGGNFERIGGVDAVGVASWDGSAWAAVGGGLYRYGAPGSAKDLVLFDDGTGPVLCAIGQFLTAGDTEAGNIAAWDGAAWSALGSGLSQSGNTGCQYDDGNGPSLYVFGRFIHAGGAYAGGGMGQWTGLEWVPTANGIRHSFVTAMASFDDGMGRALYVGGGFTEAGPIQARGIAKWDGLNWAPLGAGVVGEVLSMGAHDDGSGMQLYVGGSFGRVGSQLAQGIARWDGAEWEIPSWLGGGMNAGDVNDLAEFDAGDGAVLYAAGTFTTANDTAARSAAWWDGAAWHGLAPGINRTITGAVEFDDGTGAALYVVGDFSASDGSVVNGIAKWNGSAWEPVGGGLIGSANAVAVFDDGTGPALYVGGGFSHAGGVRVGRIARWDGTSWSDVGGGLTSGGISVLAVLDDGSGPALYAGGSFVEIGGVPAAMVARWDGTSWSAVGTGLSSTVHALAVFDDGTGPALYAGGDFSSEGHVAVLSGGAWSPVGGGFYQSVQSLAVFDDGTGPALFAGGPFVASPLFGPLSYVAKWNGAAWSAVGDGLPRFSNQTSVNALRVFDDGSGPALYAGGSFAADSGHQMTCVARWDGTAWSPLGVGVGGSQQSFVEALVVADMGEGPSLFVGGNFGKVSDDLVRRIAWWDGAGWNEVGGGLNDVASALVVHDDGTGPALYVGGSFTEAGGQPASRVAKWDGAAWSALAGGVDGPVYDLAVYNGGGGPALYAAGAFTHADGSPAGGVAVWRNGAWTPPGLGMDGPVKALAAHQEITGSFLYAGGYFSTAGGSPALNIAKWDGTSWSDVDGGLDNAVFALASHTGASGPWLYAGGVFTRAGDRQSFRIGRFGRCPNRANPLGCAADFDQDGQLALADFVQFRNAFVAGDLLADFDRNGTLTLSDFVQFRNEFVAGCD